MRTSQQIRSSSLFSNKYLTGNYQGFGPSLIYHLKTLSHGTKCLVNNKFPILIPLIHCQINLKSELRLCKQHLSLRAILTVLGDV